ncbi:MAG: hypothetical protein AB7G93_22425 [Bdellovibrionales bacterium]
MIRGIRTLIFTGLIYTGVGYTALISSDSNAASFPPDRSPLEASLSIPTQNIRFTYAAQGGELSYSCRHEVNHPIAKDWDVECGDESAPHTVRRFTVHFRIWAHSKTTSPRLTYEVLFWVTHHGMPVGSGARYLGSTIRFHLDKPSDLRVLDLAQDVEDTYVLRAQVLFN